MANKQSNREKGLAVSACVITSIEVSCSPGKNYRGEKSYRTVFRVQETERLWVDVGMLNKRCGEEEWEADVKVGLYRFEGEKAVAVAEKTGHVKVGREDERVTYEELFTKEDYGKEDLKTGIYRILAEVGETGAQSGDIYMMEGTKTGEYCRVLDTGVDRCCEETEEQCDNRGHSFRVLDGKGLRDIRFYLMAQNLLDREWVYEFVVRVLADDGDTKVLRRVVSGQYVKTPTGNHICFAVDLGGGMETEGFWTEGEYTVLVYCLGMLVSSLHFSVGDQDVPRRPGEQATIKPSGTGQEAGSDPGKDKEEILDSLYRLVGLRKVKEEITRICEYAEFVRLRRENGFAARLPMMHMIFTGHPGTGKNTVAGMIAALFNRMGILPTSTMFHYDRAALVGEGNGEEEHLVRQALAASRGGVMLIDRAGDLFHPDVPDDRGIRALALLMGILSSEINDLIVILADEDDQVTDMLSAIPDLKKVFTRQLYFEDYSPEELMEITRIKLEKRQYRFTPAAEEKFHKMLQAVHTAGELDFMNGTYIDERIEAAETKMAKRLMANGKGGYEKEALMLITEDDIADELVADPVPSLEKLKTMVGLGQLKQGLLDYLNYIYFIRERQRHGFADVLPPLNMIFSGNPGTGKQTVAKMIGEIYHSAGIVERPEVMVQNGRNFTADSGLSPQQVAAALLDAAGGGILYIEDADVLPASEFGLALFELLLSSLSTEDAGEVVMILAGYPDRIGKMLETNPTLKEYFPNQFQFNDYTPDELLEIALAKLKEKSYILHPKALELLRSLIRKIYDNKDKRFGNALLVEKLVAMAIRNLSGRIMKVRTERELTRQEMTTILEADVPTELPDMPKFGKDMFDEQGIASALEDLDKMVGQVKLKKQVHDFVELARHYSQQGMKLSSQMSLQWSFTGNSALGKGTMARIIGRLYKAMGIVPKGHVLDFKVEKLVGMLEEEAQRSIGEALALSAGGILLFDEDSPKLLAASGFRERVRVLLMNQLAERPGSYIVIYAGPKGVNPVFNGEAGQEIVNVLNFEDYTKDELILILKRRLEKERMKLTATARQHMYAFIGLLLSTEERCHASSRLMRIVADLIVRNCLQRMAKSRKNVAPDQIISVQKQDVAMFTEPFIAGLVNERKKIGFV